jgi:hypothetical protein
LHLDHTNLPYVVFGWRKVRALSIIVSDGLPKIHLDALASAQHAALDGTY